MRPAALLLVVAAVAAADPDPLAPMPPGGANARAVSAPAPGVLTLGELAVGTAAVRVPTGTWTAPAAGVATYAVAAPVAAVRGADGAWFGHGYLESASALRAFTGTLRADGASLAYAFADGAAWTVELRVAGDVLLIDETSTLGAADRWVLDASVGWQPTSGAVADARAKTVRHVVLPCFYDKAEAIVKPALVAGTLPATDQPPQPAGLAVYRAGERRVLAAWAREVAAWQGAANLGFALWQHRQLPGRPDSRHPLGPETKSDATPNPRTASLLGPSLYEGHVTLEFALGTGSRRLALALVEAGAGEAFADPLLARMQEHRP